MIRSLLWKDAREHLATVLTLCLGGIGFMIGIGALMALEPGNTPLRTAQATGLCILLLAPGIALLLGSLFQGADKETGVNSWLDSLPESAWKIWLARNVFALFSQLVLVGAWGIFWFAIYSPREKLVEPGMVVFLLVSSMVGLAWGQWGMHRSRTVFGGFGSGVLGLAALGGLILAVLALLTYFLMMIFKSAGADLRESFLMDAILLSGIGIVLGLPFIWVFLVLYRDWRVDSEVKNPFLAMTKMLWWLSIQSLARPFLIMMAIGLVLGFVLPESFLIWPVWSLSIGVVSGLCVLSQDQNGSAQIHGSMRAFRPLLFDLRAIPSFVLGLMVNLVPLLPLGIGAIFQGMVGRVGDQRLAELFWPGIGQYIPLGSYLFLWWGAGFGTALWCSFFLEKSVVSFVVAWGLGALVSSIWVPALVGGGLSAFWILGLVAVFWLLGRYLYRGFVSQNLTMVGPRSFGLMVVCVVLFCGLGILSRMYPVRGQAQDPFSLEEISQTLKNTNPQLEDEVRRYLGDTRIGIGGGAQFQVLPENVEVLLNTPVSGWSPKVIQYLKEVAPKNPEGWGAEWKVPGEVVSLFGALQMNRVITEPFSLYRDRHQITSQMQSRGINALWEVSRGTKGAEDKFANEIDRILYLGECLRHKSHFDYFQTGEYLERFAYQLIDYHLHQNKPTENGLAALAKIMEKVDPRSKQVKPMTREIGFWISRKSSENRSVWRKSNSQGPTFADKPWVDAYWQMVDFALSAPWEKERARKLVNRWFASNPPTDHFGPMEVFEYDLNMIAHWHLNTWSNSGTNRTLAIEQRDQMTRVIHDLAKTAIALKRFRIAKGAWPKALAELAPVYLKEIPKDSYSQGDFSFRIISASKPPRVVPAIPEPPGKVVKNEAEAMPGEAGEGMPPGAAAGMGSFPDGLGMAGADDGEFLLAPETLILWSVGPNGTEQGSLKNRDVVGRPLNQPGHSNLVFLVGP